MLALQTHKDLPCRALDDLAKALKRVRTEAKRSTLFMILIPRKEKSNDGKQHVRVVLVELQNPQLDGRKVLVSDRFYFAVGLMLRELAS